MAPRPIAIVYIDGFNLYYGLLRNTPHRWLDLSAFAKTLLPAYDLLLDGFRDRYDVAVVVSNDSDLLEPVRMIREELGKKVHIVFTGRLRRGSVFQGRVDGIMRHVNASVLQRSQLPEAVHLGNRVVRKPREW